MDALYELKEKLCKELEDYGKKGELSAGALSTIDTLAHAVKNIDKIIEVYENDGYSNYGYGDRHYRGMSYARRGRYSRDGYSRSGEIVDRLRSLMDEAPDDRTRKEIQNLVSKMEMM